METPPGRQAETIARVDLIVAFDEAAGAWIVSGGDGDRPFKTKQEAVRAAARECRERCPAHLVIKTKQGRVQQERNYPGRTTGGSPPHSAPADETMRRNGLAASGTSRRHPGDVDVADADRTAR
jgi:hypothetical protein